MRVFIHPRGKHPVHSPLPHHGPLCQPDQTKGQLIWKRQKHTVCPSATLPHEFIRDLCVTPSSLKEVLVEILVKGLLAPHKLKSECALYALYTVSYILHITIFFPIFPFFTRKNTRIHLICI